jgi:hypothetical protein
LRIPVPEKHFRWIKIINMTLQYAEEYPDAFTARGIDRGTITDGFVTEGPLGRTDEAFGGSGMTQVAVMTPEQIEALVDRTTERALAAVQALKPGKKLLSGKEVEEEYGISERTLERWRNEGIGPQYTTVGRRIYYERIVLDAYIEAGRVKTCGHSGMDK